MGTEDIATVLNVREILGAFRSPLATLAINNYRAVQLPHKVEVVTSGIRLHYRLQEMR